MPLKELVSGTHHFGCRVEHLHLLQDGGAVAGNDNVTFLILDLKNTEALRTCVVSWRSSALD